MPKIFSVKQLGNYGVNTDLNISELQPEFFTSGINFRLINQQLYSFNGNKQIAVNTNFNAGQIMTYAVAGNDYYLLMGDTSLYKYNGATWTNISPVGSTGAAGIQFLWNTCLLGSIAIMNNPSWYPLYYYDGITSDKAAILKFNATQTWQAKGWTCNIMRAHKNFLFALNMTESGVSLPYNYRWSHPADNNGLPYTWDTTDLSSIAGQSSILGNNGPIIDGMSLRDQFVIYAQNGVIVLDYVGSPYIWQARRLSSVVGALTTNCIANIFNAHVVLTDGDIVLVDGNSIHSLLNNRIKTRLMGSISSTKYAMSYSVVDMRNKEVWMCIPEEGYTTPNLAIVYNWVNDKLSLRDLILPWSAADYGVAAITSTSLLWSNNTNTWQTEPTNWSFSSSSPFANVIIAVNSADSSIHTLSVSDGAHNLNTFIERLSYSIEGEEANITVNSIFPKMSSSGSVLIQIGSQEFHDSPIMWQPAQVYNPITMRKIDVRSTGKLFSWRIESIGIDNFTLSGLDFEYEVNGTR